MKAIRIKTFQNHANYRKEETSTNRMTYPLPPFSTVIGAIHNACEWNSYHPMKIGILGNFSSLEHRIFTNNGFLNYTRDDRDTLVKCPNNNSLSSSSTIVAIGEPPGKISFNNNINIKIINYDLYKEWISFDEKIESLKEKYKESEHLLLKRLNEIKNEKSLLDKNSTIYNSLTTEEKQLKLKIKNLENELKEKTKKISDEKSLYKLMYRGVKTTELLTQVNLIIYLVPKQEEDINEIMKNINRIIAIGRTEDSVDIISADIIDLYESDNKQDYENDFFYNQYIDYDLIKNKKVVRNLQSEYKQTAGTIYYIPKDYTIIDNKRIFNRKKVVYTSGIWIDDYVENIYIDKEENKIINLF